jgi:hypothetical protein
MPTPDYGDPDSRDICRWFDTSGAMEPLPDSLFLMGDYI